MALPLLEIEGTWEEIKERIPDFSGRKLHVIVLPAEEETEEPKDTRSLDEKLAEIAASIPKEELAKLPPDFCDQLDHYIYGTPKR
ncbi:MAG TPA: hypothetical protein VFB21_23365 [Chthonomonadaceae bacterium]|jgi:hypothetical protein|nr:hypothetical protein [Chthonomonadaceae bacterium]